MINSECKPETYYTERREMLRFIPPGVRNVLDIGCGKGNFGALLKTQRSAEVWGVELCPDAAREAIPKIDKVITSNIETDIMDITHLRFFTVNSIRDMFTAAGYQVELLKGINYEKMPLTFHLLNLILLNGIIDMRYVQFACVARKKGLN